MRFSITKDDILDALEDEPLRAGNWVDVTGCRTCAVGAVLRNKIPRTFSEVDASLRGEARAIIYRVGEGLTGNRYASFDVATPGNWMAALSIVWEMLVSGNSGVAEEEARELILEWADENIPEDYVASFEGPDTECA